MGVEVGVGGTDTPNRLFMKAAGFAFFLFLFSFSFSLHQTDSV